MHSVVREPTDAIDVRVFRRHRACGNGVHAVTRLYVYSVVGVS